ncbi:MAG: FAD:protein FMN transferase [Candidatus Brocadiaceae bacterium]|nr:FAD:protein FMN transferase [Candidatus Brocadiaceae bacterium]
MEKAGHRRAVVLAALAGVAALAGILALAAGWTGPRPAAGSNERMHVRTRAGRPGRFETSFQVMGTDARFEVAAPDARAAERLLAPAVAHTRQVEARMSTYRPDSEVSRLNRHGHPGPVPVSEETEAVLLRAADVSRRAGGAFDVTYAPLRTLWRTAAARGVPPTPDQIERVRALVGWEKLRVEPGGARFAVPGMEIDLGGIAKGYAIDRAVEALQAAGAASGLVDIGGDLRTFGTPPASGHWAIRVRRAPDVAEEWVLRVGACAVTTSGDYARWFRVGDRHYSHIIDPRNGRPVGNVPSATVVAPDATLADGLATAISVLGPAEGVRLVDALPGAECMILERRPDGGVEVHMSTGFALLLEGS